MPTNITVQHFPEHPEDRQYCLVWIRKCDGQAVRFHCSTKDDCEKALAKFKERAILADEKGWTDL
jgi:hypothetical protein